MLKVSSVPSQISLISVRDGRTPTMRLTMLVLSGGFGFPFGSNDVPGYHDRGKHRHVCDGDRQPEPDARPDMEPLDQPLDVRGDDPGKEDDQEEVEHERE